MGFLFHFVLFRYIASCFSSLYGSATDQAPERLTRRLQIRLNHC